MNRIVLCLLAFCAVTASCTKTVHVPVSYAVENERDTTPQDVYVPTTGEAYVALTVKFLTGSATDSVTLSVHGVPAGISVTPQKASGIPTYYYKYVYTTKNMPVGSYPVYIQASAPGTTDKYYSYNLVVIPTDCATLFTGNLTGSNDCGPRGYTYMATATATGTQNTISINNLGGYGLNTNTYVTLDCQHDSLHIPSQVIGNGVTIEGKGTFTLSKMTIYYSAVTAPGAAAEVCTANLTK